jgi:hypothetical protein
VFAGKLADAGGASTILIDDAWRGQISVRCGAQLSSLCAYAIAKRQDGEHAKSKQSSGTVQVHFMSPKSSAER